MRTARTVDDVWKMFEETNRLFQESRQAFQESRQAFQESLQESQRAWEMRHQETERAMAASQAATDRVIDRVMQELAESQKETDRKVKEVSAQIGNLGGRWGEFVEGLIVPACIALFTARGLQVDEVYTRAKKTVNGRRMEIDILVANTVDAVLVEVKSRLQVEDVRIHLERIAQFKSFFPRYANCRVYGAVAGIVVESEADQFAMNQGLFVIEQSGETVRLANDMAFEPKVW